MTYSFTIEEFDGKRGVKHRAIIYRDGKQVSVHGTSRGAEVAKQEAARTIKFYERQAARDRAAG